MQQVSWATHFKGDKQLIELAIIDFETVRTQGVYVIYLAGNPPKCVYVGKGDVSARLKAHKDDKRFEAARKLGTLLVAFTAVAEKDQPGVEKYLATRHPPMIGERHPDVAAIAVNSPLAA